MDELLPIFKKPDEKVIVSCKVCGKKFEIKAIEFARRLACDDEWCQEAAKIQGMI